MSNFEKFSKIENANALGVVSLAIRPNQASKFGEGNLSGKDLQKRFDRLANAVIKEYNNLVTILGNAAAKDANGNKLATALAYIAWRVKSNALTGESETESLADFMSYLSDGTVAKELLYVTDPTAISNEEDGTDVEKVDTLSAVLKNFYAKVSESFSDVEDDLSALERFTGFSDDEDSKSIPDTYYTKEDQKSWAESLDKSIQALSDLSKAHSDFIGYADDKTLEGNLSETFTKNTDFETAKDEIDSDIAGLTQKAKDIESISESAKKTAEDTTLELNTHKTDTEAHSDIRLFLKELNNRVNALHDVDDVTLDQASEVIAFIKSNKSLIDAITTSKVNVADIIDNLTTNVSNKPLSSKQGVVLKAFIDAIVNGTTIAKKAEQDGNGNVISKSYVPRKNETSSSFTRVYAIDKNDNVLMVPISPNYTYGDMVPRRDSAGNIKAPATQKTGDYYVSEKHVADTYLKKVAPKDGLSRVYGIRGTGDKNESATNGSGQEEVIVAGSVNGTETYRTIPRREAVNSDSSTHPGTFDVWYPKLPGSTKEATEAEKAMIDAIKEQSYPSNGSPMHPIPIGMAEYLYAKKTELKDLSDKFNSLGSGGVKVGDGLSVTEDGTIAVNKSSFRGNGTGFTYQWEGSTDADTLKGEGHYFMIFGVNIPEGLEHGFLDVDYFDGTMFAPHGESVGKTEVIKQTFRPFNSNDIYVRTYIYNNGFAWTEWEKINPPAVHYVNVTGTIANSAGSYDSVKILFTIVTDVTNEKIDSWSKLKSTLTASLTPGTEISATGSYGGKVIYGIFARSFDNVICLRNTEFNIHELPNAESGWNSITVTSTIGR